MRKLLLLLAVLLPIVAKSDIIVAPGTLTSTAATLIWDKPAKTTHYKIIINGKQLFGTDKCNITLKSLRPLTVYNITIIGEGMKSLNITFKTYALSKVVDITSFGAKGDGTTLNTKAIQSAIDACPEDGTVLIPEGTFLSGALFLKSHMTLQVNGTLKGSSNEADYLPYIKNRFEGWEMETYASLLNAGVLNKRGGYSVEQLIIRGEGTISGGGRALGQAMIDKGGMRSRGRLICLMNCKNVAIQGLQIEESPCWTIHYIYCQGVTCQNLNIVSTVRNGDGIDPDSSTDCYIFNCIFSTGDDCIAIKSGKNPTGYYIGKPTKHVVISNCDFQKGHGISIGSEMSGGVSDVLVQDCIAGKLLHGFQIKATKERGGYVRDITVADCQLLKITILSELPYNNDGDPAPVVPVFENFTFRNIDLSGADTTMPVMDINGFKDAAQHLKNLVFTGIVVPENARVVVNDADKVVFKEVSSADGKKAKYLVKHSTNVVK
jgi:polygalacturonase